MTLSPLASDDGEAFDVIVGNPPWLSYTGRQHAPIDAHELGLLIARFPAVSRWPASHPAFLALGVAIARVGGRVGMVLPRQLADLDSFGPIRAHIGDSATLVDSVQDFGEQAFEGVTQPVGLFTLERSNTGLADKTQAVVWRIQRHLEDASGQQAGDPAAVDRRLLGLVQRMATLPRFAAKTFFDPGVHTGNVAKKIILTLVPGDDPRWAPIREGRNIKAFHCSQPRKWVVLNPELAEGEYCRIRAQSVYTETPILLRQTADRPIAARHKNPTFFRNSILACRGVDGLDHAVLVGFLNSSLYAFLHQQAFKDAGQKAFPQVKVKHLHALPAPSTVKLADSVKGEPLGSRIHDVVLLLEEHAHHHEGEVHPQLMKTLDRLVLEAFDEDLQLAQPILEALQ